MGIPSYFRGILVKYPGCLTRTLSITPSALCFDFNCLIYRCIRGPSMPIYTTETHDDWEKALLQQIEKTVKEVWTVSGKPKKVLLAVDGVVPMAKIRQQRVRRFKSAWLRKNDTETWDTNAITPGTQFMERLGVMLKGINTNWTVSGVDEEGEGEHKIMKWLRTGVLKDTGPSKPTASKGPSGPVVVYGLDADLILLSMLTGEETGLDLHLLREKQEFGHKSQSYGEQEYQCMNIREFQKRLGLSGYSMVLNYVGYMSLMGNDFLPHSLTHKLSEDGHEFVMRSMNSLKGKDGSNNSTPLVDEHGTVSLDVLKGVFEQWSSGTQEEERIMYMIKKKREQAVRGVGKGMAEEEGLPLIWNVEAAFVRDGTLVEDWKDVYWNFLHRSYDKDHVCNEYLKGFQWILDYYTGKPVNMSWIFPAWVPPLWSDLASFLDKTSPISLQIAGGNTVPTPEEQLSMVLPLESWGLIRNHELRKLPILFPQMWPKKFGFVSMGRKWLWECEAGIPVLLVEKIRGATSV